MMKMLIAAVLAVGIGCGGDEADEDPLAGTWIRTSGSCALGFTFRKGTEYEFDKVCTLNDGSTGFQGEIGIYAATATVLTLTPTAATCRGITGGQAGYSVTHTALTLTSPSGIAIFPRATATGGGGGTGAAATFGCFDNTAGTFTASPLAPL